MGKRKDLSEFDKGQIVIARQLDQNISKTAALVGCSRSAVVSIYQKWSKEGTVMNRKGRKVCIAYLGNTWQQDLLWEEGNACNYGHACSGNVLLGNLGSCHPCGCYFDTYHLPKHCCRPISRSQSNRASVGCAGQTSLIHGGPTSQLTGLKGSAANILVPDTTAHLQGSSGVHASMGQGCSGSKRRTNTILVRWS
ncbi:hypothetical protein QTP70_014109 [Hemibagrus guttatus]|uniref:Uncharacterized protein n=1 Tax=Hemibagrus guttatus TaxID=175788 RepID=A0AAE0R4M7_9TELE|nr:hypothetical protein QTP70_014109 [Hemibagrus guttatus]